MTEIVEKALTLMVYAMIIFPFVCVAGSTIVNVYFNRLEAHYIKMGYLKAGYKVEGKADD